MNLIKAFNHTLNNSVNKQRSDIFLKDNDFLINITVNKLNKREKVLLVGAGKMQEFSLLFFVQNFDQVVISDIDTNSINERLEELNLNEIEQSKIVVEEVEYTGLNSVNFFEDFSKIGNFQSIEEVESHLNLKMNEIRNYLFLGDYIGSFNFVYVSPIYTQLVYQQVLRQCSILRSKGVEENILKFIEGYMLDEMIPVINRFNSNLMQLLDSEGILYVLSDILQLEKGTYFFNRVSHSIKNREIMNSIYDEYSSKYGMGLGDYGIYNLDQELQCEHDSWHLWDFTEKIRFAIKLKTYRKKI